MDVFTKDNCQKAFEVSGLVPVSAQAVLDRLNVRLRTPLGPPLTEDTWESKTLSNTHEFLQQSKLISNSISRLLTAARNGFSQLIKGAEVMLHQNVLLTLRITKLKEQMDVLIRRKVRKRKRIQHSRTIEYSTAAAQVATQISLASLKAKKLCSSGNHKVAHSASRHCSKCGETGHNSRTCQVDGENSSESDNSTIYISLLFDSDENDNE